MVAIQTSNLVKRFDDFEALKSISLKIEEGSIVGFIGPNGSGKTTTMRILATLETATEGEATVMGESCNLFPDRVRRLIGFMPDYYGTYPNMTIHDYLDFFARAQYLSGPARRKRVREILEYTELSGIADKMIEHLSKGLKQRVSLGRTLVHDPPVLILDEPAAGLDPRARIELRELLRLLAGKLKKTVFISSHILTELGEICDSVVVIEQGEIRQQGQISSLVDELQKKSMAGLLLSITPIGDSAPLKKFLLEQPLVSRVENVDRRIQCLFMGDEEAQCQLLNRILSQNLRITEFTGVKKNLEDIFMDLTEGELR